jgi:regulatory protein
MSPLVTDVQIKRNGVAAVTVTLDSDGGGDGGGEGDPVILPLETVVLHHLRAGTHLDAAEWTEARTEGRRLIAVRRALDLLARRQRTEHELRTALGRAFEPDEVEHAVERMRTLGYLDDAAWAKNYVSGPRANGRGRALLRRELSQRGVADRVAASAVEEHDERPAAFEAAAKRARSLRRVEEPKRSRRLYDFLRRRGFSDPVAREAIQRAIARLEEDTATVG